MSFYRGTGTPGTGTAASRPVRLDELAASDGSSLVGFIQSGTGAVATTVQDKAREIVSVDDFGADPTGVADSSAAFKLCYDASAGKRVIHPGTQYLINATVVSASNNLLVDFGSAKILNTTLIPVTSSYGEDYNPCFDFTGNQVQVKGGHFKDGLSEGIRITGAWVGGDTYTGAGYTENHQVSGQVFENWAGATVQIRFFNGARIEDVTVMPKGAGTLTSGHSAEVAFKYGTDAKWSGVSVQDNDNGGGIYGLYVDKASADGCYVNVTQSGDPQSAVAYYYSYCKNVENSPTCQGYALEGGQAYKGSHGSNLSVTGGRYENAGTGTLPYAAIFMQGVNGYTIKGAKAKGYAQHVIYAAAHTVDPINSTNGAITDCEVEYALNATSALEGGGIYVTQNTALTRGGVTVKGNKVKNGTIFVQLMGGVGVDESVVTDNDLTFSTIDPPTTSAGVRTDRCYGLKVGNNHVHIESATVATKVGIQNSGGSFVTIAKNSVTFIENGIAGSVAYLQDGSPTANTVWWEDNDQMRAATPFSGLGSFCSRTKTIAADIGDANATIYPGIDAITQVWNTAYTGNHTCALSTSGAFAGAEFLVVRTAAATGDYVLDVGTGPLASLRPGGWCRVRYNGNTGAWMLADSGRLIKTGTFTCGAAATTTVNDTSVLSASARIAVMPTNAAAATLMGAATALYVSAKTAATSFAVTTGNGVAAAGTETFDYIIVN